MYDDPVGNITTTAEMSEDVRAPQPESAKKLSMGPLTKIYAFWLAGMSCDGCTIGVAGATNPPLEGLLNGTIAGLPQLVLFHPALAVEAGDEFMHNYELAERGELDAPFVVCYEGSIADERTSSITGGYWSAMGAENLGGDRRRPIPSTEWLKRLAPKAAAVVAVGTCATWGGIPAAAGNPTNAMSVMDFLGKDYRGTAGLPVINIPGCSPIGDNFTETVGMILLFLQGFGPLPEFDELGRPAWLFNDTVHNKCVRAGFYEEGTFAEKYGDRECLVEIGCWGPVVQCNITQRGAINHMGGCMNTGGICIGCTMPGFPDKFAPFYATPPGSSVSTNLSRSYGAVVRRLRRMTMRYQNQESRWEQQGYIPSGWSAEMTPSVASRAIHFLYEKMQFRKTAKPGSVMKASSKQPPQA